MFHNLLLLHIEFLTGLDHESSRETHNVWEIFYRVHLWVNKDSLYYNFSGTKQPYLKSWSTGGKTLEFILLFFQGVKIVAFPSVS